jgi:hypothetical protein
LKALSLPLSFMDCQCSSYYLLVQYLTTPLATSANTPSVGSGPMSNVRSLLWLIDHYFISINSHVSWHLYQLDPIMFCEFHHGYMVVPD